MKNLPENKGEVLDESKAFTIVSWLALPGIIMVVIFYLFFYVSLVNDPALTRLPKVVGPAYNAGSFWYVSLLFTYWYIILMPVLVLTWFATIFAAILRGLVLNKISLYVFIGVLVLYLVFIILTPDYINWMTA